MWWSEDEYNRVDLIPPEFEEHFGPQGAAVVKAYQDGKTDPGWGQDKFMPRYEKGLFAPSRLATASSMGRPPFAFIMRSLRLVCIDIDGKNGGFDNVGKLGMLPYTLGERSKSSNGYHLFYKTSEDAWDGELGFAEFKDRIGIQQGVDFRATGCVYHWPNQRWNHHPIAELPQHLKDMLRQKYQAAEASVSVIMKTLATEDQEEIAIMHDNLIEDLARPIPAGRRNNTLFAIGSQLMLADVPGWETLLNDRALQVGLDSDEVAKLIRNVTKYGANA